MKKLFIAAAVLCLSLLQAAGIHICKTSGPVKNVGKIEIVVEKSTNLLKFAAKETQKFLKQATGQNVPVVSKPTGKAFAIILGDSSFTRAAGIDVKKLPEEGYVMLRKGNKLFIAGLDHPTSGPLGNAWLQAYNRNTMNAVYDFFERFAGAGFFFPGTGVVIPARKGLFLPENLEVRESPDMKMRTFYLGRNKWFEKDSYSGGVKGYNMDCLQHRLSHTYYPFGHGLSSLDLIRRFGKTNPEYFAKMEDGKRFCDPAMPFSGQVCWNSKLKDVIIEDAKAFFRGLPPKSRGLKIWNSTGRYGKYFSVMAQDWFYWCGCDVCKKIAEPGRNKIYKDMKHHQAVSNNVWQFTADVANAIKKAKLPGIITQMAYLPYDLIPECDIPDNVKVMVAVAGKGGNSKADKAETAKMAIWVKKVKQPVMVWTYAIGKHGKKNIKAAIPMLARNMVNFVENNKHLIDGIFWEAETDLAFLQYFNQYVISRKMWNTSLSADEIISRHHDLMFGKGAAHMKKVFDELEKLWLQIINNTVDTGLGPVTQVPSDLEIWTKIYSPAKMKQINAWINAAVKSASSDKEAVKRIEFIRKHLIGPLQAQCDTFHGFQNALDSWKVYLPGTAHLRAYQGEVNDVATKVSVSGDDKNLYFRFDCEEPRMKDIMAEQTTRDSPMTYADSAVEIMLNPSGDRKNYVQFVVNSNGALSDYKLLKNGKAQGIAWNSSASAKAEKRADGWSVTVTVPRKDLGKLAENVPANFARHRALKGNPVKEIYYHWSPVSGGRAGFHEIERWGTLSFAKKPAPPMLHVDFCNSTKLPNWWGTKKKQQVIKFDKRVFISGGQSVYMKNVDKGLMGMSFNIPELKP
ncbi:MAG: DUF4838 domain-containing protein, partial [Lentisphaeria bacterium]|nr:DUF4838 domain-containing protein [Lentisphaeria bacterium]